jgi:hypothetical protein
MEKVEDFDWNFSKIELPKTEFYASFDPDSGSILSVGPSCAFEGITNIILIDEETALSIIEGRIPISSCMMNISSGEMEFVETKTTFKIDDVLHRIPNIEYTDFERFDLYIIHNTEDGTLIFELAEDLSGTRKNPVSSKKRKINWSGETKMYFFLTDYNDPNVLYQIIELQISDLSANKKTIKLDFELPNRFSIYTRRIFENCVIETV